MIGFRLGGRLLRRDLRSGELRVLLAALVLAVMAVSSVGFVTDRAGRALDLQANALLGGDAVLRADAPIDPSVRAEAAEAGLSHTALMSFPSMLRVGETLRLSELRALDDGYPLRGGFRIQREAGGPGVVPEASPRPGEVWLSRAGASQLDAKLGDPVFVGERELRLSALVLDEPDAVVDYFNAAPKAFFHIDEIPATGLEQFGSRITYRVVVAGEPAAVERWVAARKAGLDRGQRLETAADARPEIRRALDRADRFLGLAALVSVVLAGIAIAMAARRHVEHQLDGCAVMRCMGASQNTLLAIYAGELFWLGVLGTALGLLLAYLTQALLAGWLAAQLGLAIPAAGWLPAAQGLGVAMAVLLAFALPPILALRKVPAMRVLRRDLDAASVPAWLSAALGIVGLGALLWWKAGDPKLAVIVLGGIALTLVALAALAFALIFVLRRSRRHLSGIWRYGLASLGRRSAGSVVQVSALGLGLMVVLLLTLVRTDLLERWREALPADAPNRFLINIQPHQVEDARQALLAAGATDARLHPMVRGRLATVNGEAVGRADYADRGPRAQRLAEREFNLSFTDALERPDNALVAGQYWAADSTAAELSVEEDFARALGWELGDVVGFEIAGSEVSGTITSLRRVDWESFRPNFFVVMSPPTLQGFPASYISAVHVEAAGQQQVDGLVRSHPNISVIDVDAVLAQVRRTADQVATSVEYVFYFTLGAGLLVLVAAISATQDERLLEGGVMRAFGATRRQLRGAHLAEFAAIGLIAGATAAFAAAMISGLIASQVFDLPWRTDWSVALGGALVGVLGVTVTGLLATRSVIAAPPAVTLRALQA
ncbi:ABC transporter permease [Pseudomarimonas salicorniae]|uniref:FtsX-like permease family protein n=1 Tax=Pseudomarimonas salicorniae TaxID=2933270 RepID=A0ABT0GJQ8_9GAMM|nr:FtsX-like permease family protein [Lysobacter sp. CAU 1642]MCK7594771.1 FtsX-like permease family protein [Lysobacter sp. CAU 1642]